MKTLRHQIGRLRFEWAGGTFIVVRLAGSQAEVPYDMIQLPEWINASQLNEQGLAILCQVWNDGGL